ncbi:metallophosphoesterase [Ferruginibacter sp. SUN106]|uniref:metallophosphoesterase n=1 Tax=Ferruginibacter sp. SUN106 TaxID=2978348 RepID=UPI003D35F7E7
MRKLLQYLFRKPLTWMGNSLSAKPEKEAVFKSLTKLYNSAKKNSKRVCSLVIDASKDKFIIFSDQHKGNRNSGDDFAASEFNYIKALEYYKQQGYCFINLGDSEELWKYKASSVLPANKTVFAAEAAFQPDKYFKTFGNHDLTWKNKLDVENYLKDYFMMPLPVYEGIILKTTNYQQALTVFCTHGHQGDKMSDNNALSTWIVAHIWAPIQRYLQINVNTPSKDYTLRNKHNQLMYQWSSHRKNMVLITGHTHSPVFASGKYSDHPANKIEKDANEKLRPSYFNSGCCCFNDGDITGIEIEGGYIRLVKWYDDNDAAVRMILEEIKLEDLMKDLD